jgi:glycosyltransferase involved in cell wall biosynthesis
VSGIRPVRVMHIIDTLGSGGSERWLWDIVRLSDPQLVKHRVITFFPNGYFGPFVYAERLSRIGAYAPTKSALRVNDTLADTSRLALGNGNDKSLSKGRGLKRLLHTALSISKGSYNSLTVGAGRLPSGLKGRLKSARNNFIRFGRVHLPASYRILSAYLRFRPDVIHVHGFYPFAYGLFFKRVFRQPVVHTVPSLFSQMIDQGTGWLPEMYRNHHKWVDRFFLPAEYSHELLNIGVPPEKLSYIYGAVDFQSVDEAKSESKRHRAQVRESLGVPEDALLALSVGRMHSSKGHQYTLEALPRIVEQFPNLHWALLGEGPDREALMARAKELGVDQHVHLVGFVQDPLPFYAAADIYMRTPVFEGENLSSFYAIAMGLPAVGFDTECETDLIGKVGHGILVTNRDSDALAKATAGILSLPDHGRSMGQLGANYSRANLDIQQSVDNFILAYNQVRRS